MGKRCNVFVCGREGEGILSARYAGFAVQPAAKAPRYRGGDVMPVISPGY